MGCGASINLDPKLKLEACVDGNLSTVNGDDFQMLSDVLDGAKSVEEEDQQPHPHTIKLAEQILAKMKAIGDAQNVLAAAAKGQDIEALGAAIELSVKADVPADDKTLQDARNTLKELQNRQAASAMLAFVMPFKDVKVLQAAISQAADAGLDVENAKQREAELLTLERDALDSSISWYAGALMQQIAIAEYCGLEETQAELIAAARDKRDALQAEDAAEAVRILEAVVESEDIAEISAALTRCERNGDLGEAQAAVVARKQELLLREAAAELQKATSLQDRERLEAAIAAAEGLGMESSDEVLLEAHNTMLKIIKLAQATADLEEALADTSADRVEKLSRALLEAEIEHVDETVLENARAVLEAWKRPMFMQAPSGDCQDGRWERLPDDEQEVLRNLIEEYECSQGTAHNLDMGNGSFVNFNLMTISRPKDGAGEDSKFIMPLKQLDANGGQVNPEPGALHPWYEHVVRIKEKDVDWLNNQWFWEAFSGCLRKKGHEVPETPHEFFDFRYNVDYRNWDGPDHEERGGVIYNYPKGWKRFAVRVKNRFGDDNSWLRLDGHEGEWAVAFHGTTYEALVPILEGGLIAGRAQVYERKSDVRTGQTIGRGVYCTPSISVAQAYASSRTGEGQFSLDGKSALFVVTCRIKPSAIKRCQDENKDSGAYWVINDPKDIRPYGVLVKEAPRK